MRGSCRLEAQWRTWNAASSSSFTPGRSMECRGLKAWNTGEHRRKFLQARGSYIEAQDTAPETSELVFWGEWEPESEGNPIASPVPDGPRWVHRPYYVRPASYPGDLQNTDPFVFGDRFLYTLCRQTKPIRGHSRPTVSFAPCLPAALAPEGFARPAIRLDEVITPGLMMGAKATRNLSVERIKELWDAVAAQVLEQDLALGVRFDLPPRRGE